MTLRTIKHWSAAAALTLATLGVAPVSVAGFVDPAAPTPTSGIDITFNWSGTCTDCIQGDVESVTGTLMLKEFIANTALSTSNFVSFTYDGSNILPKFTITSEEASDMSGTLTADGTVASEFLLTWFFTFPGGSGPLVANFFQVETNGNWLLDYQYPGVDDMGTNGQFGVPTPATALLLPLGLVALRWLQRRG